MTGTSRLRARSILPGRHALYGRYWGCTRDVRFLHFELCYYQAIDIAIFAAVLIGLRPCAQGGHKLARGYEPVKTWSAHWNSPIPPGFPRRRFRFSRTRAGRGCFGTSCTSASARRSEREADTYTCQAARRPSPGQPLARTALGFGNLACGHVIGNVSPAMRCLLVPAGSSQVKPLCVLRPRSQSAPLLPVE